VTHQGTATGEIRDGDRLGYVTGLERDRSYDSPLQSNNGQEALRGSDLIASSGSPPLYCIPKAVPAQC